MHKILAINPGSTSTKIAYYENETLVYKDTIRHTTAELQEYKRIFDQYYFRKKLILDLLEKQGINTDDFSVIVGRGGLIRPLESGVYEVNEKMLSDIEKAENGEHASNLGAVIANEIASAIPNCRAFISDPVVVDEMQAVARIGGLPQIPRRSIFHALNHKSIARRYAKEKGKKYEELDLIIAHLGGGISVAAHHKGRVIDTNQALNGSGGFSPERAGSLDTGELVKMCFSGERSKEEILKLLAGRGGLTAHLGTNSASEVEDRVKSGDEHAKLILDAMSYFTAKSIGAMHSVLKGKTDAILLTGGIAYCDLVVDYISEMTSFLAPVVVYPGEDELEALAMRGFDVLNGEEPKKY